MAPYTAGAGSSISGVSHSEPQGSSSWERYVYGVLARLEKEENSLAKVPQRTDRISITANLSKETADIDLLLNVVAAIGTDGIITYTATNYLLGSTFTSGTGGNSTAPNLAQAAMEGVLALKE